MKQSELERFEGIAVPHLDTVFRVARTLARDHAEAEDLVQETFIRAFRGFGKFELRDYGAKPWLVRILHNVFYSSRNKQRREPSLLDDVDFDRFEEELADFDEEGTTTETLNWDQMDGELKAAFDELLPEYRKTLLLWAVDGLSYKEIAVACDCALGTVMSRLYRARQILGRSLRDYARRRNLSTERFEE